MTTEKEFKKAVMGKCTSYADDLCRIYGIEKDDFSFFFVPKVYEAWLMVMNAVREGENPDDVLEELDKTLAQRVKTALTETKRSEGNFPWDEEDLKKIKDFARKLCDIYSLSRKSVLYTATVNYITSCCRPAWVDYEGGAALSNAKEETSWLKNSRFVNDWNAFRKNPYKKDKNALVCLEGCFRFFEDAIYSMYCHRYGGTDWTGMLLKKYYNNQDEVDNLINIKYLYRLGKRLWDDSTFATEELVENVRTKKVFLSREAIVDQAQKDGIDFVYLFTAKGWIYLDVSEENSDWRVL